MTSPDVPLLPSSSHASRSVRDPRTALHMLYGRVPLGMRLGLGPMRAACARAGHPELAFDVAHVAGTNGKGSTCAMLEAMARAGGSKTGLYTSPHLCRFAERIRIDGAAVSDDVLDDAIERALAFGPELSFFEAATLAALLVFRDANVDLAILETGIGGRLDATNVVPKPRITAITRVAFDHMDRLGSTLEEIAREKAGIAKQGVPMVLGPMAPAVRSAALDVILKACALPIVMADDADPRAHDLHLGLLNGAYQRDNARIAVRIARELGIVEAARREGLAAATWPGRFERLTVGHGLYQGVWLLDGAHNPDGAVALVRALADEGTTPRALVFGSLADKAWPSMLDAMAEIRCPRIFVAPHGRAAADPALLASRVEGRVADSVPEALAMARAESGRATGPVLVCGSLYLVGETRALLLDLETDPPVAL